MLMQSNRVYLPDSTTCTNCGMHSASLQGTFRSTYTVYEYECANCLTSFSITDSGLVQCDAFPREYASIKPLNSFNTAPPDTPKKKPKRGMSQLFSLLSGRKEQHNNSKSNRIKERNRRKKTAGPKDISGKTHYLETTSDYVIEQTDLEVKQ